MNIALTLSQDKKAILVYDQPLGFAPAWIESSEDGRGLRIIGDAGEEFVAGFISTKLISQLEHLHDVFLVRMENLKPVESFKVSFVNQVYKDA
jgi:hypothetical protein